MISQKLVQKLAGDEPIDLVKPRRFSMARMSAEVVGPKVLESVQVPGRVMAMVRWAMLSADPGKTC